jgi:hypothetical protein
MHTDLEKTYVSCMDSVGSAGRTDRLMATASYELIDDRLGDNLCIQPE